MKKIIYSCIMVLILGICTNNVSAEMKKSSSNLSINEKQKVTKKDIKKLMLKKVNEVKKKKGIVKSKSFSYNKFPKTAFGFVNYCILEDNGILKLIIITSEKASEGSNVYSYLYEYKNRKVDLISKTCLGYVGDFDNTNIVLYYNKKIKKYSIFKISEIVGSYTGTNGIEASLYKIDGKVKNVHNWNWNSFANEWLELDKVSNSMNKLGVPRMPLNRVVLDGLKPINKKFTLYKSVVKIKSGSIPSQYETFLSIKSYKDLLKINKSNTFK